MGARYFPSYCRMYSIIRRILPSVVILGCQLDLDYADAPNYDTLRKFLVFAKNETILNLPVMSDREKRLKKPFI